MACFLVTPYINALYWPWLLPYFQRSRSRADWNSGSERYPDPFAGDVRTPTTTLAGDQPLATTPSTNDAGQRILKICCSVYDFRNIIRLNDISCFVDVVWQIQGHRHCKEFGGRLGQFAIGGYRSYHMYDRRIGTETCIYAVAIEL